MEHSTILSLRLKKLIDSEKARKEENGDKTSDGKIAKAAGIAPSMLSDMLKGKDRLINYTAIVSLAKYFNVSTDYLLGLSDEQTTEPNKKIAIQTLDISEKSFDALYNLYNVIEHNGYTWDSSAIETMDFFLDHEEISFQIMGLIHEYIFADFDNVYCYHGKENIKKGEVYLVPTADLHLPMVLSQWADGEPDNPQHSFQLNHEHFSNMLLQIIMDLIKKWRDDEQSQLLQKKTSHDEKRR